jgi:hypothetical protein
MRLPLFSLLLAVACAGKGGVDSTAPGTTPPVDDCSADDVDGDGLDECTELDLGTDPDSADSDGDGFDDGAEVDCVSDPLDGEERCYACGWAHNDPGTLVSTGAEDGDVIANLNLVDQCGEPVSLWDMYGEYHILMMTAEW